MQLAKQNYFQLFDLSESYGLDVDKLTAEYHRLQLEYHPDKQSGTSEEDESGCTIGCKLHKRCL